MVERKNSKNRNNKSLTQETEIVSSSRTSLWLGVILVATILLLIIFIPCPSASQYFIFRIVIAIATAGLTTVIPGVVNLKLTNGITASGALAVFVLVYFFDPASTLGANKCDDENFILTVFVHGRNGNADKILGGQGKVCLYLNSKPEKVNIDEDGKAVFTEISPRFLNKPARITIEHTQPYQSTHPDSLYTLTQDGVIYLECELQGEDKVFGEVLDFKTGQLLDSVRVSIQDVETYTNKNGWFELKIPIEKQEKFQRVAFDKKGYSREVYDSVPVHTKQPFSVVMKKFSK
jgi:hypothetical protein